MFIGSVELEDFLNTFDRHLAASHCAGDFELGAIVLFALFERGLGLCGRPSASNSVNLPSAKTPSPLSKQLFISMQPFFMGGLGLADRFAWPLCP